MCYILSMFNLIFGVLLSGLVLGNKDFNLQILDPRTIIMKDTENKDKKEQKENKLTLTLSSTFIDFGVIKPTSRVLRENRITASSSAFLGYSVIAFEDHPFRDSRQKIDIPDVTCDNGTCRENIASTWINPFAFGFGYSLYRDEYRQFANEEASEVKQIIDAGTITYKINVPKTQSSGLYTNTITYILVPNF